MEKFIEFNNIKEENNFNYNEFVSKIDNTYIQQDNDKKFDFLLSGILENKQNKSKL